MSSVRFRPGGISNRLWFLIVARSFYEVLDALQSDGGLRDFYIPAANRIHWNAVLCLVRSRLESDSFTVDAEPKELPPTFEAIEYIRTQANPCLSIPVAGAYVNCHFFRHDEIELDFRPEDYRTPEKWAAICEFFQEITDVVGKASKITYENTIDEVIESFHPRGGPGS